jgi:queuine/archaeosine tRNA-ribosyltransferase
LAYFFSQNGMSNPEIAKHVKVMIHSLTEIGLEVDATVCDQYNKAVINALVQETKQEAARISERHETYTFKVDNREIFPLF